MYKDYEFSVGPKLGALIIIEDWSTRNLPWMRIQGGCAGFTITTGQPDLLLRELNKRFNRFSVGMKSSANNLYRQIYECGCKHVKEERRRQCEQLQ